MYPGSYAVATFTAQNVGTIPTVFDSVELTSDLSEFGKALKVVALKEGEALTDEVIAKAASIEQIESVLQDAYGNVRLEPGKAQKGEVLEMRLVFILPGEVTEFNNKEGEATINLQLNWGQHNQLRTEARIATLEE